MPTFEERFLANRAEAERKRNMPKLPNVRRTGSGKEPTHIAVGIRTVNRMPFAATKCYLNFLGKGTWETTDEPATCGQCTKV
jgi:hypothetical protein